MIIIFIILYFFFFFFSWNAHWLLFNAVQRTLLYSNIIIIDFIYINVFIYTGCLIEFQQWYNRTMNFWNLLNLVEKIKRRRTSTVLCVWDWVFEKHYFQNILFIWKYYNDINFYNFFFLFFSCHAYWFFST